MNLMRKTVSIYVILSVVLVTGGSLHADDKTDQQTSKHTETTEQRDARMKWWRQARFGMFVHWGLYSGLAGTWNDQAVGKRGGMEWIQQRVRVDIWVGV